MILRGDPSGSARGKPAGKVYLVGSGPGDPGLLTLRAARLLRRADVVVHDALVSEAILRLVRPGARLVDAGKRCGGRRTAQDEINRLLIEAAATARVVVRLKGGDPFVFGRGGEEALALREAGIRFEVVPGVTAAVGVAAYAGIPLTHRGVSSSVTFVTGHEDRGGGNGGIDWGAVARLHGTLAIYMGMTGLDTIAARLIEAGRSPSTPAAVIQWGTYRRQRTVEAPLERIAIAAEQAGIGAPALVVIGEVAALRDGISWFDRLPLHGRRILVARSRAQSSRIVSSLSRLGAEVLEYPRLRSVPIQPGPIAPLLAGGAGDDSWVLLTSPAAVTNFWAALSHQGLDARALARWRIASLGVATTRALDAYGIRPDVAARTYVPTAVIDLLGGRERLATARILIPCEEGAESPILASLETSGASVVAFPVFQLLEEVGPRQEAADGADAEVIVLPSSGSVRMALPAIRANSRARIVAIGPRTAETALGLGVPVHAVATRHSFGGTVGAVLRLLGSVGVEADESANGPPVETVAAEATPAA